MDDKPAEIVTRALTTENEKSSNFVGVPWPARVRNE